MDKLESRDPKLYMFDKLSKPLALKKKDCKSDIEWDDYKLQKKK